MEQDRVRFNYIVQNYLQFKIQSFFIYGIFYLVFYNMVYWCKIIMILVVSVQIRKCNSISFLYEYDCNYCMILRIIIVRWDVENDLLVVLKGIVS